MLKERKFLTEILNNRDSRGKLKLVNQMHVPLEQGVLNEYETKKQKELGFSYIKGKNSSVLISGSHAVDYVGVSGLGITKEDVTLLNEMAQNKKDRYGRSNEGELTIGKQYIYAESRNVGDYKADTNVGAMCIELQQVMIDGRQSSQPSLILYEMPQLYSEPNKVDAKNKGTEVISLSIYEELGANKIVDYVKSKGIEEIAARDVYFLRMGKYDQLAILEKDATKKEALLECNNIISNLDKKGDVYKKLIASLGVLKMHRGYFEKQEELLYQNGAVRRPVNLEIHTCFDTLKTEENVDLVIGTRQSSSVAEPAMEYLLALFLRKKGFNVCLSTLNTFSNSLYEEKKKSLGDFIKMGLELGLLDSQKRGEIEGVDNIDDERILTEQFRRAIDERLKNILAREKGKESVVRYLKSVLGKDFSEKNRTGENLSELAFSEYLKGFHGLSFSDKKLKLKQELTNLFFSERLGVDRLRDGLSGLSSLDAKFKAREKYPLEDGQLPLPAIFQIEIVKSIMTNPEKRRAFQVAIKEFVQMVEKENFDPGEELKNII